MQDDMLSGNPIQIAEMSFDIEGMMDTATFAEKIDIVEKTKRH